MFSKVIHDNTIPPNFLNSILTNAALYTMFKDDYEANKDYFQGLEKEEYLSAMLAFIEDALFSSNIYNIYTDPVDLEEVTEGKLAYIKNFYDDFLLDEFRVDPDSILKTKFFRGMVFANTNDLYASKTKEFGDLFEYIFKISLDYDDIVSILIKEPKRKLEEDEALSMKEFDVLCNYIKNNTKGFVSMNIVTKMLRNHAYKTNHIFDAEVVKSIVASTIGSYLETYGIVVQVEFLSELDRQEMRSYTLKPKRIILDENLIDKFLSLNYTEIFTELFFEAEYLKTRILLERNEVNYATLKSLMLLIVSKADLTRLFIDESYHPTDYDLDLKVSCFIKTLRFFSSFGVNLFSNFNDSQLAKLDLNMEEADLDEFSTKEISLDQRFFDVFEKLKDKTSLTKKYAVLGVLFDSSGNRIKTVDLIKKYMRTEHREFIEEYLDSRIVDPEMMIEDVIDLSSYRPKEESVRNFLERELKYIYIDSFYYSLESYLKLKNGPKFDKDEYLADLAVKINCIKDTPLTHRFIDCALFTIEETQQNI